MGKTPKPAVVAVIIAVIVLGGIASYYLLLGGRGSSTTISPTTPKLTSVSVVGAGATFPYPQIAVWVRRFNELTGVRIDYQSVGSGAGLSMFLKDKTVDFACSDPPLTRTQWEGLKDKVMQIPWLLGSVAIVYNVPEIPKNYSLRLTGEVLAKIYGGEITSWNDSAIVRLNPEVANKLPNRSIIAVHRSDASGTTEVFTTFLHKSAPDVWPKERVGKTVNWPVTRVGRGVGGKGNEGVTVAVLQTPYSIGYVELSYALEYKLPIAAIRNAEGEFTLPLDENVKAAAAAVKLPTSPLDDFSYTMFEIVYAPGRKSYPITSFTYIILWREYNDRSKALALAEFLRWVAREGYKEMVPGYTAPPQEVLNMLLKASELLTQ